MILLCLQQCPKQLIGSTDQTPLERLVLIGVLGVHTQQILHSLQFFRKGALGENSRNVASNEFVRESILHCSFKRLT